MKAVKCFKCGCDDKSCIIVPCTFEGKKMNVCNCCLCGECECK
jgi:hypothetical protein